MWAVQVSQPLSVYPRHHTSPFPHKTSTSQLFLPLNLRKTSPLLASYSNAPVIKETSQTQPTRDELLGSNNWDGLLEPLDLSLRKFIIRCGEFCQATYDSFINDQNSKYCGACRYSMRTLFEEVSLLEAPNYYVSAYLYATSKVSLPEAFMLHSLSREKWDEESNWMGFIAVTSDESSKALGQREIYITWRGTTRDYEWFNELGAELEYAEELLREGGKGKDEKNAKAMKGWLTIYTSCDPNSPFTKTSARKQVHRNIKRLLKKYEGEKISIITTGHSLGAILATLSAFDIVENEIVPSDVSVSAILFASPQVGNKEFKEQMTQHSNLRILSVKNTIDLVPRYPSWFLGYVNHGTELVIDSRKSPCIKHTMSPVDWHSLEAMLHVMAGWNGTNEKFELKVKRSLALVNKYSDLLKDEYMVPVSWWVEKNKGMIRTEDGEWVTESPCDEHLPVPPDHED